MKILYYSSPSFADCDFPLIRTLLDKGYDVTYLLELSPESCRRTLFNINKCLPVNEIILASSYDELKVYKNYLNLDKVFLVNTGKQGNPYIRMLKMVLKVAKFIRNGKFDICHSDMDFMYFQPLLYLIKPWIITLHDPFPHSEENTRKVRLFRKVTFLFCKRFVILNRNQLKQFTETYKIPLSNVLVNRLGVYDNIHAFVQQNWTGKKRNILFFGRITPYKGIEYLCEAMKQVHQTLPDATLTIAGSGKLYFDSTEYESLPYIEWRNHFIDIDELANLVYECSIVVCPYKEATQSGVIMTAFSMCKPVIATNVGGLAEMVEDGKSGLIIPPCDTDSLTAAITGLLSNDNELERMNSYIKNEYFNGKRSWSAIADRYIEFYKS